MATWMVHLRIADGIMKGIPELERQEFIMGNIAPDSGVPNEDWSVFTPNTNVSHFKKDGEISIPLFSDKYMNKELWAGYSEKEKSFFLGYYVHLLTDVLWKENIVDPSMERFRELFEKDKDAIWKFSGLSQNMKRQWDSPIPLWRNLRRMPWKTEERISPVFTGKSMKIWNGNILI